MSDYPADVKSVQHQHRQPALYGGVFTERANQPTELRQSNTVSSASRPRYFLASVATLWLVQASSSSTFYVLPPLLLILRLTDDMQFCEVDTTFACERRIMVGNESTGTSIY